MAITAPQPETAPLFLTLPKAARRLGVSAPFARSMARSGALPVVQVGGRLLVIASLLNEAWFNRPTAGEGAHQ